MCHKYNSVNSQLNPKSLADAIEKVLEANPGMRARLNGNSKTFRWKKEVKRRLLIDGNISYSLWKEAFDSLYKKRPDNFQFGIDSVVYETK